MRSAFESWPKLSEAFSWGSEAVAPGSPSAADSVQLVLETGNSVAGAGLRFLADNSNSSTADIVLIFQQRIVAGKKGKQDMKVQVLGHANDKNESEVINCFFDVE